MKTLVRTSVRLGPGYLLALLVHRLGQMGWGTCRDLGSGSTLVRTMH
jgi:hypothetical protein